MVEKTCALDGCNNPVPDGRKDRRFCTPDHMKESRKRAARYAVEPRPCERCGQMIEKPYSGNQKYHRDSECWYEARRDSLRIPGLPTTRRCRNKDCIERFVPVNPQHWYHEPGCQQSERLWSVEEILAEEGALLPGGNHLEMAKAAFGQKNQALRENTRLRSLRDYLTFELRSFYDEYPEYRLPKISPPTATTTRQRGRDVEVIVQCSDWQVGKWEDGFGVEATKKRIEQFKVSVASIVKRQQDAGYKVKRIVVTFGGDLIENCWMYGGQQVSGLDRTSNTHRVTVQVRVVAHLIAEFAAFCATLVPDVTVESVPGNHGRPNAKTEYADPEDNWDTLAAWWAQDLTRLTPRIKWNIHEDWWGGFETMGHYAVMFHGDQWRGPFDKLDTLLPNWITNGVFGGKPKIVLTHHRHNLDAKEIAGVKVFQNGTIDGGSKWYLRAFGKAATPAQRVLVVSEKHVPESVWDVDF
jgi:hypothetical protein